VPPLLFELAGPGDDQVLVVPGTNAHQPTMSKQSLVELGVQILFAA
jgi:hypothetical protein